MESQRHRRVAQPIAVQGSLRLFALVLSASEERLTCPDREESIRRPVEEDSAALPVLPCRWATHLPGKLAPGAFSPGGQQGACRPAGQWVSSPASAGHGTVSLETHRQRVVLVRHGMNWACQIAAKDGTE